MTSIPTGWEAVAAVDDEIYTRCEVCAGRIDADQYPYLSAYDYWCTCPLKAPQAATEWLGEPYTDPSGLPCWFSVDGSAIYKPYPSGEGLSTPPCTVQGPHGEALFVWPNPALEPPLEGRKISIQEQAARYREIKRILWAKGMPMREKLALIESYEMTGLYPGTIMAGGCVEPVSLNMRALGERMGCNAETAGRAVQSLAQNGLVERQERRDSVTGHTIVHVAPARRLGFGEVLQEPERKIRDRGYRRCKSCGSENVETRHICHACGTVETIQPPADADSPPAEVEPTPTDENTAGGTIAPPTDENTNSIGSTPAVFSSVGGTPVEPSPSAPVASNRNRPYRSCCGCGRILWRSFLGKGWSCGHCGHVYGEHDPDWSAVLADRKARGVAPDRPLFGVAPRR